jgi:TPR repeat protein
MKHIKWRFVVFCLYSGVSMAQRSLTNTNQPKFYFRSSRNVIVVLNHQKRVFVKGDKLLHRILVSSSICSVWIQSTDGKTIKKWPQVKVPTSQYGVMFNGINPKNWKASYWKPPLSKQFAVASLPSPIKKPKISSVAAIKNSASKSNPKTLALVDLTMISLEKKEVIVPTQSRIEEGKRHYELKEYTNALTKLASVPIEEINDPIALIYLGNCYLNPESGQKINYPKSLECYERATQKGENAEAYWGISKVYLLQSTTSDKAISYLHKASALGHLEASLELGRIYFNGTFHTPKNELQGFELMQNAAEGGLQSAQYQLAKIYTKGTEFIPRDLTKAKFWYAKVAQH